MNWAELEEDVYQAASAVFANLQAAYPDERFYAFALYTDSGSMTICPAANSREALARKLADEGIEPADEDVPYYTWSTSEWTYESWEGDRFNDICTKLRDALESVEDYEHFQAKVFQTMTGALARVRDAGVLARGKPGDAPVLFVTLTDDDEAEAVENASAKTLNSPEVYARFAARYASGSQD